MGPAQVNPFLCPTPDASLKIKSKVCRQDRSTKALWWALEDAWGKAAVKNIKYRGELMLIRADKHSIK